MKQLEAIEAKIVVTEEKLAKAETAGNEALIIIYGNLLIEQLKAKNILSTRASN